MNLNTAADVVDALGGIHAVAEITGTKRSGIYNWLATGQFPADTYLLLQTELKIRNLVAPDYLWPMRQAVQPKKNRSARG
jgi:DNA-binding phage protein